MNKHSDQQAPARAKENARPLGVRELLERLLPRLPEFFVHFGFSEARVRPDGTHAGQCPLCRKGELRVNFADGLWGCYGGDCEAQGNPIKFVMHLRSCGADEAVRSIHAFLGLEFIEAGTGDGKEQTIQANLKPMPIPGEASKEYAAQVLPAPEKSAPRPHPYERFVQLSKLTDEHRKELKDKRGFSDELINQLRFRSGGDYLRDVVTKMRKEYRDDELSRLGILWPNRNAPGGYGVNSLLIAAYDKSDTKKKNPKPPHLIPYLDKNGICFHLRPHKLGFNGMGAQLYHRFALWDNPVRIVLTEGEYKAAALSQYGISALAAPGITSFGGYKMPELNQILESHGVKEVVVIFDQEEKGLPEFSGYKEDPAKRHDTPYWAYRIAKDLEKAGYKATVGELPRAWMVNGKIDFDGALAGGKTKEEIDLVLLRALVPDAYLASLPGEARGVVTEKIRAAELGTIQVEGGKYVAIRSGKGESPAKVVIAKFTMELLTTYSRVIDMGREDKIRTVRITPANKRLKPLEMDFESRATLFTKYFSEALRARTDLCFEGTDQECRELWEMIFSEKEGVRECFSPKMLGWVADYDCYLLADAVIRDGHVYRPDWFHEERAKIAQGREYEIDGDESEKPRGLGIIWTENKGFLPMTLSVSSTTGLRSELLAGMPRIGNPARLDLERVARLMYENTGTPCALAAIGWTIAAFYRHDIVAKTGAFPHLFLTGFSSAGKTSLARRLTWFFGFRSEGGIALGSGTTINALLRGFSSRSSLCLWLEEYRNENRATIELNSLLRTSYDGTEQSKGTLSAQTNRLPARAAAMITGQHAPNDQATLNRLLILELPGSDSLRSKNDPRKKELAADLDALKDDFPELGLRLMLGRKEYAPQIIKRALRLKSEMQSAGAGDRQAFHWGLCAAALQVILGDAHPLVKTLLDFAFEQAKIKTIEGQALNEVDVFWDDVATLVSRRMLKPGALTYFKLEGDYLYVWMSGLYAEWERNLPVNRRTEADIGKGTLTKRLASASYCKAKNKGVRLGGGHGVRIGTYQKCLEIDLREARENGQESILEIAEAFVGAENEWYKEHYDLNESDVENVKNQRRRNRGADGDGDLWQ
jgi:DNA primase